MKKCCICREEAQSVIEIDTKEASEGLPLLSRSGKLCNDHFWYFWGIVSALLPNGCIPLHQIRIKELSADAQRVQKLVTVAKGLIDFIEAGKKRIGKVPDDYWWLEDTLNCLLRLAREALDLKS